MASWKDLKAQGVRRCCAVFNSGNRCRRRASKAFDDSWCDKHGPVMKKSTDNVNKAIEDQRSKG
jgi:hypothetical protein